ncbi:hypothetical protein [Neptuniibacter sp. CAU 1671]|uniref:hypothetical protein n=1 Tax=Neptuniibacter sp. CAU 1671 TaxID=3032593 RepID=UPI0023DBAF17|nr:hypothetical protein [Neptuniibacter sp. CAU 1671]MDF2182429.1 hypothetical protein [Neptuniibacter sp. CAU 1671]
MFLPRDYFAMTNGYRPLFNRKYLTALIWFCLIAILILTSLGTDDPEPGEIQIESTQQIYWLEQADEPLTLTLIFSTPAAIHPHQQLLQALMQEVIRTRLQPFTHPDFSYHLSAQLDGISLSFSWLNDRNIPPLVAILSALRQPLDPLRWATPLETLKAESYLNNQTVEQNLLNQFFSVFPAPAASVLEQLEPTYARSMHTPAISLTGEGAEQAVAQLPPLRATELVSLPEATAFPSDQITLDPTDQNFHLLLGSGLPGRLDQSYLVQRWATQLLQDLLVEYRSMHPDLKYRLLFHLGRSTGYRAMLLHSPEHPAAILQQLTAAATQEKAEQSRSTLLDTWQSSTTEPLRQRQLVAQLSHYQLPVDQVEKEIERLSDLDPQLAVDAVRAALQSRAQFSILRPGQ